MREAGFLAKKGIAYTLYLVTDRSYLNGLSLAEAVEQAINGGVDLVQLREKSVSTGEFFQLALTVKQVTDRHRVPLIINDRLDIALAVEASGLHIGQSDLPAGVARRLLGAGKILGVSAATLEEAVAAEKAGADYLGIGAVFPTATKGDAALVSLNEVKQICSRVKIPAVAIGGISGVNLAKLKDTGIDGVAVVSAIMGSADPRGAAHELKERLKIIGL